MSELEEAENLYYDEDLYNYKPLKLSKKMAKQMEDDFKALDDENE